MSVIRVSYTAHDELIVDHVSSGRVIAIRAALAQAKQASAINGGRPVIVRKRLGNWDHFVAVYENGAIGSSDSQMRQNIKVTPDENRVYVTQPREYLGLLDHNKMEGSRTFDIIGFSVDRSGLILCTRCYLDPATLAMASADDGGIDDIEYSEMVRPDQPIDSMDHDLHTEDLPLLCDVCGHVIRPGTGPYIGCDDEIAAIRDQLAAKEH